MSSKRTVLFINDSAYLLEGFRESKTHIRGRWVPQDQHLVFKKYGGNDFMWTGHYAGALADCSIENEFVVVDTATVHRVEVPETMFGDHNMIIKWAQARKKTNAKS